LESLVLPAVYTPAQIAHAYGFDTVSFNGTPGDGSGVTIAIVGAYSAPNVERDLHAFNVKYQLPQLDGQDGNGTLTVIDRSHGTLDPTGGTWELETALDVQWAHAIAPRANILLVSASSDALTGSDKRPGLLEAVDTAAQQPGVTVVSMSWGSEEFPGETSLD